MASRVFNAAGDFSRLGSKAEVPAGLYEACFFLPKAVIVLTRFLHAKQL
jgi:hypothetical protein